MEPELINCGTIELTVSTGMANPSPENSWFSLKIAVVTPINRPALSKQRPARVARVDGCVHLDHVLEGCPALRPDFPPQPANDSRRQGLVEAERAADGEHLLSHLQVGRLSDGNRLESRGGALILSTARSLAALAPTTVAG